MVGLVMKRYLSFRILMKPNFKPKFYYTYLLAYRNVMDFLSNNKSPRLCKPRVSDGSHEGVYSVGVLSTVLMTSAQCWCPHA